MEQQTHDPGRLLRHDPPVRPLDGLTHAGAVHDAADQVRLHPHSVVGDGRVEGCHLKWGHRHAVADGRRSRTRATVDIDLGGSRRLTREVDAGTSTEPPLLEVVTVDRVTQFALDEDRAGVRRPGEYVLDGQVEIGMWVGIVIAPVHVTTFGTRTTDHFELIGNSLEERAPLDGAIIDGGRHGDQLLRRARLIGHPHRRVLQEQRVGGPDVVGIETGRVHHGENLSGLRIQNHDRAALGVGPVDGVRTCLRGSELDVQIDRGDQVGTGHGRDDDTAGRGNRSSADGAFPLGVSGGARQRALVEVLEPFEAFVVPADEPHDR